MTKCILHSQFHTTPSRHIINHFFNSQTQAGIDSNKLGLSLLTTSPTMLQDDHSHPNTPASPLVGYGLPANSESQSGMTPREIKQQRLDTMQKDPYFIPRLMRRVLLTKGREVTPKQVYWNFSYRDRPSVALIHQVMKELDAKGLGTYGRNERKTTFAKKQPWSVQSLLVSYGINIERYEHQYHAKDVQEPTTYTQLK